jgi:hypothetical protein
VEKSHFCSCELWFGFLRLVSQENSRFIQQSRYYLALARVPKYCGHLHQAHPLWCELQQQASALFSNSTRIHQSCQHTLYTSKKSPLADLLDPTNMAAILVNNLLKKKNIARQRSPFNNSIFAKLCRVLDTSSDEDQVHNLLFGVVALGCLTAVPFNFVHFPC